VGFPSNKILICRGNDNDRFRWAACQLDELGKCVNRTMLRKALAALPPSLDETYDRILSSINEDYSQYAIRILRWLTFSARPLSLDEVAEVVAIDIEREPAFDRDEVLEDPLEALNICSSLITVNKEDQTQGPSRQIAALAHYSVKEYLVSTRIRTGKAAKYSMHGTICHEAISTACLRYLLQIQQPELAPDSFLEVFKLARYSAEAWISHLQKTDDQSIDTSCVAVRLLSKGTPAYLTWIRLYDPDAPWPEPDFSRRPEEIMEPLYYAGLSGLGNVVKLLLDAGVDVNAQGGKFGNALQAASVNGYEQVVKLLLDAGADVNAQGGHFDSALQAASVNGQEQVVKLLLDTGANGNAEGGTFGNALQAASVTGQEQVVKLLLDAGANVNAQGGWYGNALQSASVRGHEQVVKLLLNAGADVNAQGGEYDSALEAASSEGYEQVVKLLLDAGADVNAQDGGYCYALQVALVYGHEQVVKLLLDAGANAVGT
jgi:ankyrin repeat protein